MIVALSTLFKEVFIQEAMSDVVARMTAESVGEAIGQIMEAAQEASDKKLQVLGIESDTWYLYHLADGNSWGKGLHQWSQALTREIPRQYLYKHSAGGPGSVKVPFTCKVTSSDKDLLFQIRRLPGVDISISKQAIRDSIVATVRSTLTAYTRCVAVEGNQFPEDFEKV